MEDKIIRFIFNSFRVVRVYFSCFIVMANVSKQVQKKKSFSILFTLNKFSA